MNIFTKIILLGLLISPIYATTPYEANTEDGISGFSETIPSEAESDLTAPFLDLFATTQWDLFMREFEMKMKIGICCMPNNPLTCAIGFKAKMIEPIGYMETTNIPLYFIFADIDLGGDPTKGNSPFNQSENSAEVRTVATDAHFIYVPIMGMIFEKSLKFVCFHQGDLSFPYMSEFDPTWKQDVYYGKMILHMLQMFSPNSLLSTIFDCIATETVNSIRGGQAGDMEFREGMEAAGEQESLLNEPNQSDQSGAAPESDMLGDIASSTIEKMDLIRDTMYFVSGCSGFSPVGGYVNGEDALLDSTLIFHGIMGLMHGASAISPKPFLYKQTNMTTDSTAFPESSPARGTLDTMCMYKDYALPIPSQYLLQLAYPTVGSAKEVGAAGSTVSTAKGRPGSKGGAFTVWVRRDYYAFAYFCTEEDK